MIVASDIFKSSDIKFEVAKAKLINGISEKSSEDLVKIALKEFGDLDNFDFIDDLCVDKHNALSCISSIKSKRDTLNFFYMAKFGNVIKVSANKGVVDLGYFNDALIVEINCTDKVTSITNICDSCLRLSLYSYNGDTLELGASKNEHTNYIDLKLQDLLLSNCFNNKHYDFIRLNCSSSGICALVNSFNNCTIDKLVLSGSDYHIDFETCFNNSSAKSIEVLSCKQEEKINKLINRLVRG